MMHALWSYRGFIGANVGREFNGKYRESLLGAFWSIANPLTMIVIYTVIFGQLLKPTLPGHESTRFAFSIYLCAGVITWTLFAEMLGRLTNVFLEHGNLIKKASFPKVCLPAIVTLSALINFAIILALQVMFTLGLGIFLGTLNVFFRDVGQFTGVVLQFWFWLTPIVYTLELVPEPVRGWLQHNPMQPLIRGYQTIFLDRTFPDLGALIPLTLLSAVLLVLGARFFLKRVGEMVDEL